MYRKRPVKIDNILPTLCKDLEVREDEMERLRKAWKKVVGAKTGKMSKPWRIKDGMLHITVYNSAWMYDMKMKQEEIIRELNENLNENIVKDIKFRVGSL